MLRATASRPWTSPTCGWMYIQGWLCFLSEGWGQKGCADFDADMEADMAELVAIAFEKPDEADRVLTELARLQKEYLIDLEPASRICGGGSSRRREWGAVRIADRLRDR